MRDVTRIELKFIAQDCTDLIQLILGLQNNSAAAAIGLGLSPYITLFAEESFHYLTAPGRQSSGNALTSPLFDNFSRVVTKLRARAKLFDDNEGGLERLIETLALAHQKSIEWFLHRHRGCLGIFKRHLQPDLGIYYLEEHVICTTYTALLTIGLTHERLLALGPLDMKNLRPFVFEFNEAAGRYLNQIQTYLNERYNIEVTPLTEPMQLELPITHNDHYGHLVYKHISDDFGLTRPELSTAIIFLVAQINFVERFLTHLLAPTSSFLLRARFMTAYHATKALQKLERLDRISEAHRLDRLAQDLLNEPDSTFLLRAHKARNIMAHYELRNAAQFLTPDGDPLNDALLGLCGQGIVDVTTIAQRQLSRISEAFIGMISKTVFKDSHALFGDHT